MDKRKNEGEVLKCHSWSRVAITHDIVSHDALGYDVTVRIQQVGSLVWST